MFKGDTLLQRVDSETYKLRSMLTFENDDYIITIKNGLQTNGASIPRAFWTLIGCPMGGKYVGSALIHDALYGSHVLTKEESDKLFLDMMKDNGVDTTKRNLMFWAVKFGGRSAWYAVSDDEIEQNKRYISVTKKGT